jgi:hypothetical protein
LSDLIGAVNAGISQSFLAIQRNVLTSAVSRLLAQITEALSARLAITIRAGPPGTAAFPWLLVHPCLVDFVTVLGEAILFEPFPLIHLRTPKKLPRINNNQL